MTTTEQAQADDWVQIHRIVLTPEQRPANLPDETRAVPLEMRTKGWLITKGATLGDEVTIRTAIGREMTGRLIAVNPAYGHDFGQAVPELLAAGDDLVALMRDAKES
jgi:hypothetical protein